MRYCKDCKHFEVVQERTICRRFKRTFVTSEHPVYGPTVNFSAPDCAVARAETGQCGPQARYYEARMGTLAWMEEREREEETRAGEVVTVESPRSWWRFW